MFFSLLLSRDSCSGSGECNLFEDFKKSRLLIRNIKIHGFGDGLHGRFANRFSVWAGAMLFQEAYRVASQNQLAEIREGVHA